MSEATTIAWTDSTWNPVRGCTKVSAGCRNCYAERFAERWRGIKGHPFEQGFDVRLVPEALDLPLRWRKARRVFVNSMSDLFHENVPDSFIDQVFARVLADRVFEYGPRHTFQVLTKRAARLRSYFEAPPVDLLKRWARAGDGRIIMDDADIYFSEYVEGQCAAIWGPDGHATTPVEAWSHPEALFPLSNLWLGVSVEDQRAVEERIPELLATPAALRFVSCEPLLGPVDLTTVGPLSDGDHLGTGLFWHGAQPDGAGIDWVIVGGESGPGARPCDVSWVRSIVKQCAAAGVSCFTKQLGAAPVMSVDAWNAHRERTGGTPLLRPPARTVREDQVHLALQDRKGADLAEWPNDLRVQQFPEVTP